MSFGGGWSIFPGSANRPAFATASAGLSHKSAAAAML
jgi:hypothetical protein